MNAIKTPLCHRRQKRSRHPLRVAAVIGAALLCGCNVGANIGANSHNISGRQAYESGQVASAINQFQTAINLNPQNSDAYYNLGASYYALAKQQKNQQWLDQSEQLYRQAIALNDQNTSAHRGLAALLIESGKEKYAFDLINSWKQRYPTSPEPVIELARLYQEYGDNRRAADLLTDALRLDSSNVRTLKAMGHIREIQGQTHLALDNYLRVLQLDNQQPEIASRVASLHSQISQSAGAPSAGGQSTAQPRYGSANPYLPR